jgi:hypothetical protein
LGIISTRRSGRGSLAELRNALRSDQLWKVFSIRRSCRGYITLDEKGAPLSKERAFPNPEKQSHPELKLFPRCPGKKLLYRVSSGEKSAVIAGFFQS